MILFTADWHIKLGQKNVPPAWAIDRYQRFFAQVWEIEETVDLHIIGGDLFDRLPTMQELELFFDFISDVKVETIIYDGNHEATKKNKTFLSYLAKAVEKVNPLVWIVEASTELNGFGILPYCDLHLKDSIEKFNEVDILFTHVRGEIPPHVKPEVDLSRFDRFKLVFAGDLHAHSNTQRNIVYPGSPMTTSFHRNEVDTGYILIDETDWSWTWHKFDLPQLIRKTVSNEEEMVPTPYHHTVYELEGDLQDLSMVKNSDLLDKKIVKRSSEASLILEEDMNIEQELVEYLTYILALNPDKITDVVSTFNDYSKNIAMG